MKKTVIHAALFALTLPLSGYGVGLGEMTVESSLDQPFLAEIELLDVGSGPIGSIKVGIADPENFQQIGIEPIAALSLLNFKVEKNVKGKFVIKVRSTERMTEPYMEMVVDLIWPHGQLYKAYTVLLDPPGYQLVSSTAQSGSPHYRKYRKTSKYSNEPGVINKEVMSTVERSYSSQQGNRKNATYGPTITNENVWQIAQRYKTSELILPQVVLAIVGANPQAFTDGNLNGLKVGVRLAIPSTQEIAMVPAELATEEVMAHDKAWNEKSAINHVIAPPYMNASPNSSAGNATTHSSSAINSELPTIPKLGNQGLPAQNILKSQVVSVNSAIPLDSPQQYLQNNKPQSSEQDTSLKTELSITTAAIESVRESNSALAEQLHLLQDQNKKLQTQLEKRDKDMELIRSQMHLMMKERMAVASQATSSSSSSGSGFWSLVLLLLAAGGGGVYAYWYFRRREQKASDTPYLSEKPKNIKPYPQVEEQPTTREETSGSSIITTQVSSASELVDVKEDQELVEESTPPIEELVYYDSSTRPDFVENDNVTITSRDVQPMSAIDERSTVADTVGIDEKPERVEFIDDSVPENDVELSKSSAAENSSKQIDLVAQPSNEEFTDNEPLDIEFTKVVIPDITVAESKEATVTQDSNDHDEPRVDINGQNYDLKNKPQPPNEPTDKEENNDLDLLEFESGLHELIEEKPEPEAASDYKDSATDALDFVSVLSTDQEKDKDIKKQDLEEFEDDGMIEPILEDISEISDESILDEILDKTTFDEHKSDEPPLLDNSEIDPEVADFFAQMDQENTGSKTNKDSAEPALEDDETTLDVEDEAITGDAGDLVFHVDEPVFGSKEAASEAEDESGDGGDFAGEDDPSNPLKSKKALDTLLSLAKTYIGMDDIDSARLSLEEVMEHGNETQKKEAKRLFDEIKYK